MADAEEGASKSALMDWSLFRPPTRPGNRGTFFYFTLIIATSTPLDFPQRFDLNL